MGANASEKSEFRRKCRITEITKILKEINDNNLDLDESKFLLELVLKYGCSERKAKEYLKIARFKLNYDAKQTIPEGEKKGV